MWIAVNKHRLIKITKTFGFVIRLNKLVHSYSPRKYVDGLKNDAQTLSKFGDWSFLSNQAKKMPVYKLPDNFFTQKHNQICLILSQ